LIAPIAVRQREATIPAEKVLDVLPVEVLTVGRHPPVNGEILDVLPADDAPTLAVLSPAQHELLLYLSNKPIYAGMESAWASLVGPLADNIAGFLRTGLLEESSAAEKLNCKFRVADLKALLKQHGAKASGKKADLIMALLKVLSSVEMTRLVG